MASLWIKDGSVRVCNGAGLISDQPCPTVCGGSTDTPDCCTLPGSPPFGPPISSRISGSGTGAVFATTVSFNITGTAFRDEQRVGSPNTVWNADLSCSGSIPITFGCRSSGSSAWMPVTGSYFWESVKSGGVGGNTTTTITSTDCSAQLSWSYTGYPTSYSMEVRIRYTVTPASASSYNVAQRFRVGRGSSMNLSSLQINGLPVSITVPSGVEAFSCYFNTSDGAVTPPFINADVCTLGRHSYNLNNCYNAPFTASKSCSVQPVLCSGLITDNNNHPTGNGIGNVQYDVSFSSSPRWSSCAAALQSAGVSSEVIADRFSPDPRIAEAAEAQIRAMGIPCCGN